MASVSGFPDFSDYVKAFEQELQSSQSPEKQIDDKVSACAFLALANRGNRYARMHPDLKRKAVTLLNEKKEAPLVVQGVNLSELAENGDVRSLSKNESLIQTLSPHQKLQLLKAAQSQPDILFNEIAQLVSAIDVFKNLIYQNDIITLIEHESLIAKLSIQDKVSLLHKSYWDKFLFDTIAAGVTEEEINIHPNLFTFWMKAQISIPYHLRAAIAKNDPDLARRMDLYDFDRNDPEDKKILASLRRKIPIEELGFCLHYFDLKPSNAEEKKELIDLAKNLAKIPNNEIESVIQYFNLDPVLDREDLLEIIQLRAEHDLLAVLRNFNVFGLDIRKENELFQFLISKDIPRNSSIFTEMNKLKITEKQILFLAEKLIDSDLGHLLFDNFHLLGLRDNQEAFWTIFHMAMIKCPIVLTQLIDKIGLNLNDQKYKKELLRLAQASAEQSGILTLNSLDKFHFDPIKDRAEITRIVLTCFFQDRFFIFRQYNTNPDALKSQNRYLKQFKDDYWFKTHLQLYELLNLDFPSPSDLTKKIMDGLRKFYSNDPFISPLLKFAFESDESVQLHTFTVIEYLIFMREALPPAEQQRLADFCPIFQEVITLQEPSLVQPILDILLTKPPETPAPSLKETLFGSLVKTKNISPEEAQKLTEIFSFKKKYWKDAKFEKSFLSAVIAMIQNDDLAKEQAILALTKAFASKEPHEIRQQLATVKAVHDLEATSLFNETDTLKTTLMKAVQAKLPFLNMSEKDAEKLQKTFLSSRYPLAFFIYAANVSKLNSEKVREALALVFKSVLDGNFKQIKERIAGNPHLQSIQQDHPEILKAWFKNTTKTVQLGSKLGSGAKKEEPLYLAIRKRIQTAVGKDKHLSSENYPFLYRYFDGASLNDVKKALIVANKEKKDNKNLLQLKILTIFDDKFETSQEQDIRNLFSEMKTLTPPSEEFHNDLNALFQLFETPSNLAKTIYLSNTDDPIEIMLSGTEVPDSCQRIDGNPTLNQGILGYWLNDGRLLSLKTTEGGSEAPITSRCIVRLWRDENTQKLVMVLERIYPQNSPDEYKQELKKFAKDEADRLGVPLVSVEEGDPNKPFGDTLIHLEGHVPEYVDSVGGIQVGKYSIMNACYV
ncbi:MAG TPA: hypothetical protein VHK67_05390 [Rhabdochlamydiaceae bacterium]|jgi:hypothetical protein|nr:hypothetical protein [Rhabdochlamydiaceae bacterium]